MMSNLRLCFQLDTHTDWSLSANGCNFIVEFMWSKSMSPLPVLEVFSFTFSISDIWKWTIPKLNTWKIIKDFIKQMECNSTFQLTTPIRYGLPASPNACDMRIWKASAVDRLFGITTYWKWNGMFRFDSSGPTSYGNLTIWSQWNNHEFGHGQESDWFIFILIFILKIPS